MPRVDNNTLRRLLDKDHDESRPESTAINSIDYDPDSSKLTVEFHKRGTYEYYDVPLDTYVDFQQSSSHGTYFNLYIRDQFTFTRIA